ncbi:MAG TPA: HAD family phosphatase [bacterium]|nr:HAD family phosphatase [bacterium]
MPIKAIIFDVDGVIFDSEILHKIAWEEVFTKYNITLDEDDYFNGIGVSDRDFLERLKREEKIPDFIDFEDLIAQKNTKILKVSKNNTRILPEIYEFISTLSGQYKIAVASNSSKEFITNLLETSGLMNFFSVILGRQDIIKPKPAPDIYIKCSQKLGILPQYCCVIEDSPTGIKAAKNAGMYCIAICSTLEKKFLLEADLIIDYADIKTVENFLKSIK